MWKTNRQKTLLPFLGTKSISDCPTTRDTKMYIFSFGNEEGRVEGRGLVGEKACREQERKESTALKREKRGGKVSQWWGFILHFYLVCITCNWRIHVLILFWLHIILHSFSSDHKFFYCMGILKRLDKVRDQILLRFLLSPVLLTSLEHWRLVLANKAFLDVHRVPQELLPMEKGPEPSCFTLGISSFTQHTFVWYN